MRWMRWHCPPDTGFEIRAQAVWGRARYLSVTEAPHNTDSHTWMGRNIFVSLKPPRPGTEPRTLAWKAAVLTTTLGPPPLKLEGQSCVQTRDLRLSKHVALNNTPGPNYLSELSQLNEFVPWAMKPPVRRPPPCSRPRGRCPCPARTPASSTCLSPWCTSSLPDSCGLAERFWIRWVRDEPPGTWRPCTWLLWWWRWDQCWTQVADWDPVSPASGWSGYSYQPVPLLLAAILTMNVYNLKIWKSKLIIHDVVDLH